MSTRGKGACQFLRDDLLAAGDLAKLVGRYAESEGVNSRVWQGLTCYRSSAPTPAHWDEVTSPSYCLIVQGVERMRIGPEELVCNPMHYLVLNRRSRFEVEIIEASHTRPFLSFMLQIEPAMVRDVLSAMNQPMTALRTERTGQLRTEQRRQRGYVRVAAPNARLIGATYRFLTALGADADRAVLGPIYLREIVYRLLQSEERHRLIDASRSNATRTPVSAAIEYMKGHIDEPMSVALLAEAVCMSESAFAHLFKQVAGTSPYHFLKQLRLERARELLLNQDSTVSDVAGQVGYTSLSHFISEFKKYFGEPPISHLQRLDGTRTSGRTAS
jgi:AraC-like DNA-binding protein